VATRICSSDNAHAAQAATYRYESRCRELVERFEAEMEKIRSAYIRRAGRLQTSGNIGVYFNPNNVQAVAFAAPTYTAGLIRKFYPCLSGCLPRHIKPAPTGRLSILRVRSRGF
jgi:hypothetical protein